MSDQSMFCLVCGRVLEQVLDGLGGKTVAYQHSIMDVDADHPPVATRPDDAPAQVQYRCDFCLGEPITHTMVVDHIVTIPSINMQYDPEWAMCGPCTELALADDWVGLRRRSFGLMQERHGKMSEEALTDMRVAHAELRRSLVMFYAEPQ